jgi:hypothetical protein
MQVIAFASVAILFLTGILSALAANHQAPATRVVSPSGTGLFTAPGTPHGATPDGSLAHPPATLNLNVTLPVFLSSNERGEPEVVTGRVVVPQTIWRPSAPSSAEGSGRSRSDRFSPRHRPGMAEGPAVLDIVA